MGVHVIRKRLASGKVAEYHYAWRGGPRITSKPDTDAYLVEYAKLTRDRSDTKREGFLPELIYLYRQSPMFTKLGEKTRVSYEQMIDLIEARYHDLPIALIDQKGARSEFLGWRDEYAETPRKADLLIAVFARILSFALDREIIDRNPLERVGKLSHGTRKDIIWTKADIDRLRAIASPQIALALDLAQWTGQRQGDLLKLGWSAYDGKTITLRQGKTKRLVRFDVLKDLKKVLDKAPRTTTTILANGSGASWTESGFRASWRKAVERAGIEGLTFHDLRGTFVTNARQAGCSIQEIADISGHSEKDAESIIRKHYLAAGAAIMKLDSQNRTRREL